MFKIYSKLFKNTSGRTEKARRNIFQAFILKGFNILSYFLVVPLTLNYLDVVEYGVWLTLNTIINYIIYFDIGLGHGLRNKLSVAFTNNDTALAREYISTTFYLLVFFMAIISSVFFLIAFNVNWSEFFQVSYNLTFKLFLSILIILVGFSVQFVLKIINSVLLADQMPAVVDLFNVMANLLILASIFVLTLFTKGDLIIVASIYSIVQIGVAIISFSYYFYGKYKHLRPAYAFFKPYHSKAVMGLGIQFFILQITSMIMWNSSNIVIIRILGPEEVTSFNISYKYFSSIIMLFTIVLTPYWSAFTEAYSKNEFDWIRKNINFYLKYLPVVRF